MKVFLDTSVIIAAILSPSGGSSVILRYVKVKRIKGIISQSVVEELLEKEKKLQTTKDELEKFIAQSGLIVRKYISSKEIEPYENFVDKEDAHVIAGAKLTNCTYLVSLDKRHILNKDIQKKFYLYALFLQKNYWKKLLMVNIRCCYLKNYSGRY